MIDWLPPVAALSSVSMKWQELCATQSQSRMPQAFPLFSASLAAWIAEAVTPLSALHTCLA